MRILVTGSHGFIGSALVGALWQAGHSVVRLVRSRRGADTGQDIGWDIDAGWIDQPRLEGLGAVVHLAGENLFGRWSRGKKRDILHSRVAGTGMLAGALAAASARPRVLISASAVGYYGSRGDEELTEASPPGERSFLADVCRRWEQAAQPAAAAGIRVVHPRLGVVLHPSGGMLAAVLGLFRLGLGGPLGSGRQWLSWVSLDDLLAAVKLLIDRDDAAGPVNIVAPNPVTSEQFARTLAGVLGRPAALRAPAWAIRLAVGDMADEVALASQRVRPARLEAMGFTFRQPSLPEALRGMLK
jgi:uncharacterized protein (TIGR01777 family)